MPGWSFTLQLLAGECGQVIELFEPQFPSMSHEDINIHHRLMNGLKKSDAYKLSSGHSA